MFSNISWSAYLAFTAIASVIYYAFVGYTYYRRDLFQAITRNRTIPARAINSVPAISTDQSIKNSYEQYQPKQQETDQSRSVEPFMDEVRAYLLAAGNEVSKDDLLRCLQTIANKYPSLAHSEYRNSLEQFVTNEVEQNCAMSLGEQEAGRIWSGT